MNIRNLFVGILSVLGTTAVTGDVRADDCGPPGGAVISTNAVGQHAPQYTLTNTTGAVLSANQTVVSGQSSNGVVLAGGATTHPVVANGTVLPVTYSTSNYSTAPMVYSNGVYYPNGGMQYVNGYNGWNHPAGYGSYYGGNPGVYSGAQTFDGGFRTGLVSGALGIPQWATPGFGRNTTIGGAVGNYAGNRIGRGLFRR